VCRARTVRAGVVGALRRLHALLRTDVGDEFREPGFTEERRIDPQITIGSLTEMLLGCQVAIGRGWVAVRSRKSSRLV
jgi:hypothetical protein